MYCPKCISRTTMVVTMYDYSKHWYEHSSEDPYMDTYALMFKCPECKTTVETIPVPVVVTIKRDDE